MSKKELVEILDRFVQEKNASWNHEDWLSLLVKVKGKGFDLTEKELGELLEGEREVYFAKKEGRYVFSKQKLAESCRDFVKKNSADFNDDQRISFMNELSQIGTFNKNELATILESEKKRYIESKKQTTIEVEELDYLRSGIADLQRKVSAKEDSISELNNMVEKLQTELIKKENTLVSHLEESKSRDSMLETLRNDIRLERNFIDSTTRSLLEKEQFMTAKEAELKSKGLAVSEKLSELTKKLEYYKLLERKSEVDSGKLQKITNDLVHQKNINSLISKKASLLDTQLHSKIIELEKMKVVYKEMHESFSREKTMLHDAEKKLRELGRDAMEKKIEAEKKQRWILDHEKPLLHLEDKIAKGRKALKEKELALSKKEYSLNELHSELAVREKLLLQKETKLIISYKDLEKKKSEVALAKKEYDAKYGEVERSMKEKHAKIDSVVIELRNKTDTLSKEREKIEKDTLSLAAKDSQLKGFYKELQKLKDRLDKREIDVVEKEKKLHNELAKNSRSIVESKNALDSYKNSLSKIKAELLHKEKELDDKRKKIHNEKLHLESEKLKLEKKFLSMITDKD